MPTIEVTEEFIARKWLSDNKMVAVEMGLMDQIGQLPGVVMDVNGPIITFRKKVGREPINPYQPLQLGEN